MEYLFCVGAYYNLKFAPILPPVKGLSKKREEMGERSEEIALR